MNLCPCQPPHPPPPPNPTLPPALFPDDIGGPQPGPFLVSVVGASLQSLPLPLPPPPPSHVTIQHSLSLNGKTPIQGHHGMGCAVFLAWGGAVRLA